MRQLYLSLKIVGFLFFTFCSTLICAQENYLPESPDTLTSQTISEVVVTANRHGSLEFKTPEAIGMTVIENIQKFQLRSAPEALSLAPGVFVQKTNHGGGSPFLRGLTGNQTLQLVDGIRLSNAIVRYGPNQYFNTIDLFSIDRIEVLRGGGSVQYGSDAMGGTVQTFSHEVTTSEKPAWRGTALSRFVTRGMEQSVHGRLNYSSEKIAFTAGSTWRNFGDLVGGDTTGTQTPTGYKELDFDMKGRIILSGSSSLTMAWQRVRQKNVPVFHKIALENYAVNEMDPQERNLAYLRLDQVLKAGVFKSSVFTASWQQNLEGRNLRKNGSSILRTERDQVRTLAFSAEAYATNENGWSANNGIEIYNDLVNSSRTDKDMNTDEEVSKRGLYPDGATMTSMALFTLHTLDLKTWSINAGARFNTYVNKVEDEVLGTTTLTPSALVGNLGLLRKLNETSNLFISLNTGFRAPNTDDLGTLGIVDFRYETPNFDLKPEHSFQYQAGYKYKSRKLKGEIYLYRNELYDLIVRQKIPGDTIDGYPVYQKENAERAYVQGIETAWSLEFDKSWLVSGNMTYTYGQNISKNEPMRRIPPLFGRLALEYNLRKWWMNLEWQAAGKQTR
ncbi:MAG TPA: TonB-dependent receptor, partial [Prolixibacteraceae bacterium]|nr:TonB-dependent receptor [Prolixibacteraceae bacterium]